MDLTDSVTTFLKSIDYSLLIPVFGAFITLIILAKLRNLAAALTAYWAICRDKDLRVGGVYRFSTSTGSKIGVLTRWDFHYVRFRFVDHYERIPNSQLAYGGLQIVKIDPGEEADKELSNE